MHDHRQSAGEPHLGVYAGAAAIRIAQRLIRRRVQRTTANLL
jgi:hypothetical protein